jgi:acyl-CoA synthetase (NDP forming)
MTASNDLARAVLAPATIALIGASADENTHSSLLQRYLRRHGYAGDVFPINRRRADRGRHGGRAAKAARRVPAPPPAEASLVLLAEAGIAAFRTPESCADAVRAFLEWRPRAGEPRPAFAPLGRAARPLNAADSARVVAALGVRVVDHVVLPP